MLTKTANKTCDLVAAAIEAANGVGSKDHPKNEPDDVTACIQALQCLKGLSLSAKDLLNSSALQKLESLRDHRNLQIRTEARGLFTSSMTTLYAKPVHHGETASRNETDVLEMFAAAKKAADAANVKGILLGKSEASRCVDILSQLKNVSVTPKVLQQTRVVERLEHLTRHKNRTICSSAALLLQHWRHSSIMNQRCQASVSKSNPDARILHVSGSSGACKVVPKRPSFKQKLQPHHDHSLQDSAKSRDSVVRSIENNRKRPMTQAEILKNATELLEVFEAAKKAADEANTKGILLGKSDASRCVHCLSKLMTISVNWEVVEAHGMEKKLEYLTKHKDRKICASATALLQHWRQSVGRQ